MNVGVWIDAWLSWAKFLGYGWYMRLKWLILQLISVIAVLAAALWVAVFMYGGFYYTYMPSVTHTRDVYLQYSADCESGNQACPFPSANMTLSKVGKDELLMKGQPYTVTLDLELPESAVNQELGVFMLLVQFYSKDGEVVRSSARPALLHYKSSLYQTLETLVFLPSLLIGASEQKQTLSVELISDYVEDSYRPARGVFIQVQSRKIQIYSARMQIHAKFYGLSFSWSLWSDPGQENDISLNATQIPLYPEAIAAPADNIWLSIGRLVRYLLFYWPVTSAVCGVLANLTFLMLLALMSWHRLSWSSTLSGPPALHAAPARGSMDDRRQRIRALMERQRVGSRDRPAMPAFHASQSQPVLQQAEAPQVTMVTDPQEMSPSASESNLVSLGRRRQLQAETLPAGASPYETGGDGDRGSKSSDGEEEEEDTEEDVVMVGPGEAAARGEASSHVRQRQATKS